MVLTRVGVSAWTEKSLLDSGWYPPGARSPAARLRYYAEQFPLVEIDSSYYALPTRRQADAWVDRTPPGFVFNVKAYAPLTTHYTDARRLPRDLSAALPASLREKQRVYPRELPAEIMAEIVRRFREAIVPLHQSGKLGVVLFQYPVWFTFSPDSLTQLARTRELVPDYRPAIEFRNRTWLSERHRRETLAFLAEHDLVFACVDEPQGFASSVPPIATATSTLALVRMHGRNAKTWEGEAASAADRMAYLYRPSELREWLPRIRELAKRAREIHVIMNNCHRDFAVRNAAQMAQLLGSERE